MADSDELFEAIKAGESDRVRALIANRPDLATARDEQGVSAVMQALYRRQPDLAELVRAAHPGPDIFESVALGESERVATLLQQDPILSRARSADGFTALHFAAFFGQPVLAGLLIEHGAAVDAIARNPMQVQPLHSAVAAGDQAVTELLLRAGADPNARQHGGWTAIQAAALSGNEPLTRLLLEHGADPDLRAEDGRSALDMAAETGDLAVLALLGQPPSS